MEAYDEYSSLLEKLDLGEALSEAEASRLRHLKEVDPRSAHHAKVMSALCELQVSVGERSDDDIIEGAFAALRENEKVIPIRAQGVGEEQTQESGPVIHQNITTRPSRRMAEVGAVLAACGALFLVFNFLQTDPPGEPTSSTSEHKGTKKEKNAAASAQMIDDLKKDVDLQSTHTAELTLAAGRVLVNGESQGVGPTALAPESIIEVFDGTACLSLGRLTEVCLGSDSKLKLDKLLAGKRVVHLLNGRVVSKLAPRDESQAFSVQSGSTRATAIGTAYAVERRSGEATQVTVLSGVVEVRSGTHSERVSAGGELVAKPGALGHISPTTRSEGARHRALLAPTDLWRADSVTVLQVKSHPSGGRVFVEGIQLGSTPLSVLVRTGKAKVEYLRPGYGSGTQTPILRVGERSELQFDLSPEEAIKSSPSSPQGNTLRELLSEARAHMAAGRWSSAATSYQKLRKAYPNSPESHTVLLSLGQLKLDRLKDAEGARSAFRIYLTGGGALSQEAAFGEIRALQALGRQAEERGAIENYLGKYKNSAHEGALKKRLADLK